MGEVGHVYVLHNCEHRQPMVKLGRTTGDVRSRAKQIDKTGSPGPFTVLFSVYVSDCRLVENLLHDRLKDFRIRNRREFFRVHPDLAIRALLEVAQSYVLDESRGLSVDILPTLLQRYRGLLDATLQKAEIGPYEGTVVLTCTFQAQFDLADLRIERSDMNIIRSADESDVLFRPGEVSDAVQNFLNLDPYTYIMTTPLFADSEATLIADILEGRRDRYGTFDEDHTAQEIVQRLARDVETGVRDRALLREYYVNQFPRPS